MAAGCDLHNRYRRLTLFGIILLATSCVLPASSGPDSISYFHHRWSESNEKSSTQGTILTPSYDVFYEEQSISQRIGGIDFPLTVGNSWIYLFHEFAENQESSWRISDSVVEVSVQDESTLAKIFREMENLSGDNATDLAGIYPLGDYWWVADGEHLYRLNDKPDLNRLSDAWLELRFPFTQCWFPDPVQRIDASNMSGASIQQLPGCRRLINDQVVIETPDYLIEDCYRFEMEKTDGVAQLVFCTGVGIVQWGFASFDGSNGYDAFLSGYSISSP